jgi:hypothetical protein
MAQKCGLLDECYVDHFHENNGSRFSGANGYVTIIQAYIDDTMYDSTNMIESITKKETIETWQNMVEQFDRIETFQKMSLSMDAAPLIELWFPDATEQQVAVLNIIHGMTLPWVRGSLVQTLSGKIENGHIEDKSLAAVAKVIVEALQDPNSMEKNAKKAGANAPGVIKQFYMELSSENG